MYVAEYRCGPESGRMLSSGRCAASVMTLSQAGGPNATATSSLSMQRSLAFACSQPEPPNSLNLEATFPPATREVELRVTLWHDQAQAPEVGQVWSAPSESAPSAPSAAWRPRQWRPRQDSTLRTRLRRPVLYPLSFEAGPTMVPAPALWNRSRTRRMSAMPAARVLVVD